MTNLVVERRSLVGLIGSVLAASPMLAQTDCCFQHPAPGCDDADCESQICCFDPFCCSVAWDGICADEAGTWCSICTCCGTCPEAEHSCFAIGEPGCADEDCCLDVCAMDPFCCTTAWDNDCIAGAWSLCSPNNLCADATPTYDGMTPFSTLLATTQPCPPLPLECEEEGDTPVYNDIWFLYRASCGGVVTVQLLPDSIVLPRLAAYAACPDASGAFMACDAGDQGGVRQLSFQATCGTAYLLRVGGYGTGVLSIACDGQGCPCPPCAGDLNGSGGIDAADLAVLLANWGDSGLDCADLNLDGTVNAKDLAMMLAGWGGCAMLGCPSSGHGCFEVGEPGCDDPTCCEAVCSLDPSCCSVAWDQLCVYEAIAACTSHVDCCYPHSWVGCGDTDCEAAVCAIDPFCCSVSWDEICAGETQSLCPELCG